LRSTADDMLRFAAANLGDVKSPLLDVLKASHEKRSTAGSDAVDIGLGWHRLKLKNGNPIVWHNGGTGGFRTMVAFTPTTKCAVVVLCAASLGADIDKLALDVLKELQPK
jgi:serine-type D-Ala-D-Ala carboxypeptidase/endopeptidase